MATITTRAFVLRSIKYGEADRILHVFSESHGCIGLFVKAAAKKSRTLGAAIDPLSLSEIEFRETEQRELLPLRSAESLRLFDGVRTDLEKLSQASFWFDLLLHLTAPGVADQELFRLTELCLAALDESEHGWRVDLTTFFEFHTLRCAGYALGFEACLGCGASVDDAQPVCFSISQRAVVHCQRCGAQERNGRPMPRVLRALRACAHGVLEPDDDCRPAEHLLRTLLHHVLGRTLKSEALLDEMSRSM
ncbi:MAG: DNA repair protein RecO [Myxococcales bacterium]|nr:DNA repair protein RecO [Myxococcales bacterium]